MHNIHWAVIFSNGTTTVLLLAVGFFLLATLRKTSRKITRPLSVGSKVSFTLPDGDTRDGIVTGVETFPAGFKINCK